MVNHKITQSPHASWMLIRWPTLKFALLGSSARSPDRGSRLRTKVETQRNELHNRNCTIVRTKYSNPYNVGWEGVFIPPNLITSYQKCPSGPHEGQEITLGVFGNFPKSDSPTWILLLGSHVSCPSGTFGSGLQQASCGAAFIVRHS